MFNRDVFYSQLDEVYERRDLDAIEKFLLDTQRRLAEERAYNTPSCDLCITPADRIVLNSGYVKNLLTVQNELLSLYKAAGTDPHEGAALNVKARFLYRKKDYPQAAALFREAAQITRSYYGENDDYRICMANARKAEEAAKA